MEERKASQSFVEFLLSLKNDILVQEILSHQPEKPLSEPIHNQILTLLGKYIAIGGMLGVVQCWVLTLNHGF